jgi:hypothetical protein
MFWNSLLFLLNLIFHLTVLKVVHFNVLYFFFNFVIKYVEVRYFKACFISLQ